MKQDDAKQLKIDVALLLNFMHTDKVTQTVVPMQLTLTIKNKITITTTTILLLLLLSYFVQLYSIMHSFRISQDIRNSACISSKK